MDSTAQKLLRELADQYLDSHLIEEIRIRQGLIDVTTSADKNKQYLSNGQLTITITLATS